VLVDMTFVWMVEVTVVQVIGVAAVTHGWVSTAWAVLMRMVGTGGGGASRHGIASFRYSKCTDAAAQRGVAAFNNLTVGKSGPEWQGRTA
jgi:membrane protein required for beta-lactamase induction